MDKVLLTFLARTTQNDARVFTRHTLPKQPAYFNISVLRRENYSILKFIYLPLFLRYVKSNNTDCIFDKMDCRQSPKVNAFKKKFICCLFIFIRLRMQISLAKSRIKTQPRATYCSV
jgi:hypothetical protein